MRRALAAQSRVQRGHVSQARQKLIGAALAPRNAATLESFQGRLPQESMSAIPRDVSDSQPSNRPQFDSKVFAKCLREAPFGCSPGPENCTNEMPCVCLDDQELFHSLFFCQRRFRQRNSSAHGRSSVDGVNHDSIAETRRGSERNRHLNCFKQARCQVFCKTVCQSCGISLFLFPIRVVHQSGNRLRGPHHPSHH